MNKRGALFYVIDALVAAAVIVVTITIIFGTKVEKSDSITTEKAISNYISLLSNAEVYTIESIESDNLIIQGIISNPGMTILEAVVELYTKDYKDNASRLLSDASDKILGPQFSVRLSLDEEIIYVKNIRKEEKAKIHLTREKAITFKQEQIIYAIDVPIVHPNSGFTSCVQEGGLDCLYIRNSTRSDNFAINSCSMSFSGWSARCFSRSPPNLVGPEIVKVEIWI